MNIDKKIDQLIKKGIIEKSKDKKTEKYKFNDAKFNSLSKQASKKPEYVLVQYLTQKNGVRWELMRIVSGNILVYDNKPHEINPRDLFHYKNHSWYIIREIDMLPVSNRDYSKLVAQGRATPNASVIIKAILGAVQKKEMSQQAKKWLIWILIAVGIGIVAWIIFGGGK